MKFFNKKIYSVAILAILGISCKKSVLDINTDPNNPTAASATPELILPNALNTTASIMNNPTGGNQDFAFAGIWMGHMGFSGNYNISIENDAYQITNNFQGSLFGNLYHNINDYDFLLS